MPHRLTAVTVVFCALWLAPLASQAGTIRDDRDPSLYLNLATDPLYASVGRIDELTTSAHYIGSGTLIAQDWVLTAGHMVTDASSMSFTIGGSVYQASQWLSFPKYNGDLLAGYDIALVKLSTAVTDIAPAALYAGSDELGQVATLVGFGMTGTGLTGATTFDGQERAGQNIIDVLYQRARKNPAILLWDFDNPNNAGDNAYGSADPLDLEYDGAPGDSGGGVFITTDAGTFLAGVHSFGASFDGATDSDYGDVGGSTRVSSYVGWIDDVLTGGGGGGKGGNGGGKGGGKGPHDLAATQVPEPGTLALLAIGGLATAVRASRRRKARA